MAPTTDEKVQAAVSIVQQAQLPYPLDRLLESFVFEALNPRLAASFLQRHCHDGPTLHSDALSLVSDWKYIVESGTCICALITVPIADSASVAKRDAAASPGRGGCVHDIESRWHEMLHHRAAWHPK